MNATTHSVEKIESQAPLFEKRILKTPFHLSRRWPFPSRGVHPAPVVINRLAQPIKRQEAEPNAPQKLQQVAPRTPIPAPHATRSPEVAENCTPKRSPHSESPIPQFRILG